MYSDTINFTGGIKYNTYNKGSKNYIEKLHNKDIVRINDSNKL